jgi:hypothetical protein
MHCKYFAALQKKKYFMILKPAPLNNYFDRYVQPVADADLISGFKRQTEQSLQLLAGLTEEQANFRYAEGKWSIKELILHLIDTERIFTYRALRFARNDKTELPGYDENLFAANCKADSRTLRSLLEEYMVVRTCTVGTFINFPEESLSNTGVASGNTLDVASLGYAILGHEMHHINIIRERYLG